MKKEICNLFKYILLQVSFLCGLFYFSSGSALAHERHYVFNQEYQTLPKGGMEIESHTEFKVPAWRRSNTNDIVYQGELEYGVTDHWTISHYETWQTQNQGGTDEDGNRLKDRTTYHGFKFETKYRLFEKGKLWVDPLIYLEWETDPRKDKNPNSIEGKIVLSRDFGKFNITYNQIIDSELGSGGRTEHEFTVGMNCEILEDLHAGMEIQGNYWKPSSNRNEFALGPALSYASKYFWVAAGILFGVNHAADDFDARVMAGIPLL